MRPVEVCEVRWKVREVRWKVREVRWRYVK